MKAIVRPRYGSVEVLELRDVDQPSPGEGEVLVRMRASSLNMGDVDYMLGRPFLARLGTGLRRPRNLVLGLDVAGTVEAVGNGVTRFEPGDDVYGDMTEHGYGAFAEFVCAPEGAFRAKPAGMSFEAAATLPQSAILAFQGLGGAGSIGPGQRVLVNGASGNVGPFAVQIAKAGGAEVTGVCSAGKMDFVRSLGADHVIDYAAEDFARNGQRYDRILDVIATRSLRDVRRALTNDGVYVCIGSLSMARILRIMALGPLISMAGGRKLGLLLAWKPFKPDDMAAIEGLVESGAIKPVIDRTYPLAEAIEALRYLHDGHARGKVVITMPTA